jgi:HSP90 family molecular chaperone
MDMKRAVQSYWDDIENSIKQFTDDEYNEFTEFMQPKWRHFLLWLHDSNITETDRSEIWFVTNPRLFKVTNAPKHINYLSIC